MHEGHIAQRGLVASAWARAGLILGLTALLGACATTGQRNARLEQVAKDWSAVIRASQIIPVYPPTEDLQPGDLFLVQTTVDRQHQLYRERGYLPLDYHIGRLGQPDYAAFYRHAFPAPQQLPADWRETGWSQAPAAAFPSYAFEASRSAGLDLALPLSGVAVGLSLLGSDEAVGTVSITDAHTYGVDVQRLNEMVDDWSRQTGSSTLLASFASSATKPNYLRVISRVYLASAVDVVIADRAEQGARAGASTPAALLSAPGAAADQATRAYTGRIADINAQLGRVGETLSETAGPGLATATGTRLALPATSGRLQVMAASSHTLALRERFARPLVIGYLAFDKHIDAAGQLGPPIATHVVLTDGVAPRAGFSAAQIDYIQNLNALLRSGEPDRYARVLGRIDRNSELLFNSYRAQGLDAQTLGERLRRLLSNHVRHATDEAAARRKVQDAIQAELPARAEDEHGPVRRNPDQFR